MPKDEDVSIIHMDSKHLIKESAIRLPFGDRRPSWDDNKIRQILRRIKKGSNLQ